MDDCCKDTSVDIEEELVYDVADFFKVFGDSTRIKILYILSKGEMCVSHIAEALGMTQSAVSHQLRVLRQNDIVKFRRDGKTMYYSLDDSHIENVLSQSIDHIRNIKGY